ncbi:MAG: TIGR04282 family arsenosugar biosynthesis glycosyltransferase [Acidobacteria bacterium]|nr:TIGR04282 family arsenosugar biosynthesis glycosyltransferase [Acidobacteriota bacterium]
MSFTKDPEAALIVFAKTPVRGSVKTRMRPALSEDDCLQLHSLLLRLWLARLSNWDLGRIHKAIFLTPVDASQTPPALRLDVPRGVAIETQQGRDLGARLAHALHKKWSDGFRKLVFIGTDSPLLQLEDLQAAFQVLDSNEVVVGPATDGGYYLIGFSALRPFLLSGISWGTAQVFKQTVRLMEHH